ncbi:hypothetical protein PV04_07967 [Phialophora macrospora]|uniref:RBR-type E3 ubiquitin transferase n=1 Tax=Phialophora macrospora TaxID=1851006 RepID=A0A0D2CKA8_9EURO|nr:hypothetical protein PV04_07967 [Phialophora macrospora]
MVQRITERRQPCFREQCGRKLFVDRVSLGRETSGKGPDVHLARYLKLLDHYHKFICAICFVDYRLVEGSLQPSKPECKHDVTICNDCFGRCLKHELGERNCETIKCPDPNCAEVLGPKEIKLASQVLEEPEIITRYDELLFLARLSKDPTFRWCNRLNPKCDSGQLIQGVSASSPAWTCQRCQTQNCFTHRSLWHTGLTCEQFDAGDTVKGLAEEMIARMTKKCPARGCGRRLVKNGRCKDMHCKKAAGGCGTEFCWHCKIIYPGAYPNTSKQHLVDCKFQLPNPLYRVAAKPSANDPLYKPGWDKDPGYVEHPDDHAWTQSEDRNL